MSSIPVIDIEPLKLLNASSTTTAAEWAVSETIKALTGAIKSHSIFAITGHGIPLDVMDAALHATKVALEKSGDADRENWRESEQAISTRLPSEMANFVPAGVENIGRSVNGNTRAPSESVAKFTVWPRSWDTDPAVPERQRNIWPETSNGQTFRTALERYHGEAHRVSNVLHHALSLTMGKPGSFIQESLGPYGHGLLRALRYQRNEHVEEVDAPAMAAHRDFGTTTLLLSDNTGLQFQIPDSSEWIDVVVPRGALTVNLGEFFENWTGGAFRATLHRVSAAGRKGRTSLAYFSNQAIPLPIDGSAPKDRIISPLEDLIDKQDSERQLQRIAFPSYVFTRLAKLTNVQKGCDGGASSEVAHNGGA
jgi:isopenicillin N synthase-like dioxygenase